MEEQKSSLSPQESAATHSASALRELQRRAHTSLTTSRDHAFRLEAEINRQLDSIAAAVGEQAALESQSSVEADAFLAEVARLTEDLAQSRAAWQAERAELESQRRDVTQKLSAAEVECTSLVQQLSGAEATRVDLAQKLTELEVEREVLAQKVAKLAAECDDINPKLSSLESLREDLAQQVTMLESEKVALSLKAHGLETERDELSKKLTSAEAGHNELSLKLANLESQREKLHQQIASFEAQSNDISPKVASLEIERDDLSEKLAASESEKAGLAKELAALNGTHDELDKKSAALESQRDESSAQVVTLRSERDKLSERVVELETQIRNSQADWRNQLLDFENRLREQQSAWNEQRAEAIQARGVIEHERDQLQQKFDLALEDLQRLRARSAELEQELARRPESNQADSAELVALRAERDELAARIEDLEQRPAAAIDPDVEQQMADLQRRFELAVEDLRDYKTKCGKLESQLAAANSQSRNLGTDTGGNDWESQKRRMLAALEEGGDGEESPIEKQQRITIEGTIEMTDAVVAEKDRQIAELQSQLASAGDVRIADAESSRKMNDLVEADEVIAEHRQRARDLERELLDKLRAAEMELSIERAKMARQKSELDQLKSELDSKQQDFDSNPSTATPGQPRRRWRDKLGLGGDQ